MRSEAAERCGSCRVGAGPWLAVICLGWERTRRGENTAQCFWQAGGCNDEGQTGSSKDQKECQKTLEERIYVFLYFYVVNMRSWMFMGIVKMWLCLLGLLPALDRFQDFSLQHTVHGNNQGETDKKPEAVFVDALVLVRMCFCTRIKATCVAQLGFGVVACMESGEEKRRRMQNESRMFRRELCTVSRFLSRESSKFSFAQMRKLKGSVL